MKNFTFLIILCLPLLFFGQKSNGLSFESTSHDFGTITSNSKAVATFFFTNNSSSSIEILKVHGENHCLEIDNSCLKIYAPQEKGIITVTYNTDCKGPIRKTLSVFTSLENNNAISLKLVGKVSD
jgi:hypothetical protein